jgi:hypothetical protein
MKKFLFAAAMDSPEGLPVFPFSQLSDDTIVLILKKLPLHTLALLSCTSHRFHALCHRPDYWTSIRLNDAITNLTPFSIAVLCSKGDFIRQLCIDLHRTVLPGGLLRCLASCCSSLVCLSLYMADDTATRGSARQNRLTAEDLSLFLTSSRLIKSLHFVDSPSLTDSQLSPMLPHLQMMTEIDLSGCSSVTDSAVIKIAQQCPSLESFNMSGLAITGRCLDQLFRYCRGLKILRANGCSRFESTALDSIPPVSLGNLSELSVVGTPITFHVILRSLTGLTGLLTSTGLHDSILIPYLKKTPRLEVLYLGSGCRPTIASFVNAILACASSLTSLTFHPPEDFAAIGDDALRLICGFCTNLKYLSLSRTKEVSTFWILRALESLKLQSLALFGWENATTSAFTIIGPRAAESTLRFFCVTGCKQLRIDGMVNFLVAARHIDVMKLLETNLNDGMGRLHPDLIQTLRYEFPNMTEEPPGTMNLHRL